MSSGYGQRGGGAAGGGGFEAPACVQNAMMTKDKKPFTYTPGGIDLSQIRSERMAKRLARNAQAEGATGASQQNRPSPQSPGASTSPGTAASAMGAAAMGMPFQVLPPPPPPPQPQSQSQGKNANNAGAPPPPPPQQQSTLAPPAGRGSAPGSPAAARKSPTPQRFEPPPLGFRPEIKIPPNPMAALRKVPPPVEKNTFWKDEYVKDRSKSPLPEPAPNGNNDYSNNNNVSQDAVDAYKPSGNASNYSNNYSNGNGNGNGNVNNNSYSPYTPPSSSPKTPPMQQQLQQPTPPATPPQQQQQQPQQQFRSVPMPQSPAVNVYTRQTESPRSPFELQQQQQRATESPFRFAQQQQQQQLQQQQPRPPTAISPLAQQQQQRPPTTISPLAQQQQQQQAASAVPWRTQRAPQQQQQQPTHPQQIYNNVPQQQQQQQQQQRSRDVFSPAKTEPATAAVYNTQQQQPYQGAKPTNVGSLYIAPLAQPTEPQAQRLLLQQQQQSGARDSPMRQMPQQQQQQQQVGGQPLRWLSSQPASKEQAPWARPEENGNVVPSTLRQATISAPTQNTTSAFYQPQMMAQGNGYARAASPGPVTQQNFGTNAPQTGLRLQITTNTNGNNANQSGGPREHIIPITLEQTPTYAAAQPNFGAPAGHIIRSANQFVDQGYNKYPATADTVNSPTQHHQQQPVLYNNNNNNMSNNTTRIIPIAIEGGRGGPISQSPVVLQNDPRSPPIQSKSFRILQKITDTVDDGSNDSRLASPQQQPHLDMEPPQLQRPQFARQMSAQQARNSPTIEQMRRLQIAQDQQPGTPQAWSPQGNGVSAQNRFTPQRSPYDTPQQQQQQYVPASEQQAFEPKKYTGSAIPSRSFKILQAMTTPENAEHKIHTELDSDLENIELNETNNKNNQLKNNNNNNNNYNNNNDSNDKNDNIKSNHNREINNKINKRHSSYISATSTTPYTDKSTSTSHATHSSNSSLSSDGSCPPQKQPERSQSVPPHYPYAYGYPYPWFVPPPTHAAPWQPNGEPPQIVNWPYPYPYPPPMPSTLDGKQSDGYPPYPYYYPYYLPPPPAYGKPNNPVDPQQPMHGYPQFMPPYGPYPYPVAPSISQSSTESRASSVLPDIIITPSTDDVPSQVIMNHHIKVEPRKLPRRAHSVEIEEIDCRRKSRNICSNKEQVIDMLSQRLANSNKIAGGSTQANLSQQLHKSYAGEQAKELGARSPSENASPVQISAVINENDSDTDDSSDEYEEDSDTPKHANRPSPLQAIKSVANVQVYNGLDRIKVEQLESESEDEDVTTADEMEDEEEELVEEEHIEELEEDYIVEEDLSTIYEEESELERSSNYARTVINRNGSSVSNATIGDHHVEEDDELDKQIEDNDKVEGIVDEEDDESSSVTVRLPLRFSFIRSSNDENIATVEVGSTTQLEERRPSTDIKRNSFSIAMVESEGEDNDCEVSVTISLSNSSRSNSVEKSSVPHNVGTAEKVFASARQNSHGDISSSFSLGMRNMFSGDIMNGGLTNNIAHLETAKQVEDTSTAPQEEFDFFATLLATKMQAQKMMEQSKNFWKTPQSKPDEEEIKKSAEAESVQLRVKENDAQPKPRPKSCDMTKTQVSLEAAKNSFWSTFATAGKEPEAIQDEYQQNEDIDFWANVETNKESELAKKQNTEESQWTKKQKTVTYIPLQKETVSKWEHWTTTLKAKVECLPQSQCAKVHFELEEKTVVHETPEIEEDFWASVEEAKSENTLRQNYKNIEVTEKVENDFWEDQSEDVYRNGSLKRDFASNDPKEEVEMDFWADQSAEARHDKPNEKIDQEAESDFWEDIKSSENITETKPNEFQFDPTKYPEEPREVDTDEEIDFWAEIDENRDPDDDNVTFHKSATFWARKERQNSIDETPYKPVETKAFRAKLPDEPSVEIDVWSTLEAARGEEPELVDPVVQEEQILAEEYEELEHESIEKSTKLEQCIYEAPESNLNQVDTMSLASMHEPATVHTWTPYDQTNVEVENDDEPDFWADIEEKRQMKEQIGEQIEEAEQKRHNYHQAMAFFNTSIDGQKLQQKTQYNRNSVIVEADEPAELGYPGEYEIVGENGVIMKQHTSQDFNAEEEERGGAETPTNNVTTLPEVLIEPEPVLPRKLLPSGFPDLGLENLDETSTISVRDRISIFESNPPSTDVANTNRALNLHSLSVDSGRGKGQLSRNSSTQRSESEIEEDDSGVTDMNRQLSGTDTESESFPELRKMTSYQRAATHSRLFKLLQDENDVPEGAEAEQTDEFQLKPSRRKIIHNVSITRRQNPSALGEAETLTQRRERLSLPLCKNTSIDADNPSTPNSPASPIVGPSPSKQRVVSDKLVNELVQSLLLKSDSTHLRKLPMERLQAAAKRALAEEMDSVENSSLDSTPAITPKHDKEYADYYSSWTEASGGDEIVPSKAFRALQDPRRSPWTVRCPRVLSSKTINRDLARVTESPEILSSRGSKSPECFRQQSKERSVSSWRKV